MIWYSFLKLETSLNIGSTKECNADWSQHPNLAPMIGATSAKPVFSAK